MWNMYLNWKQGIPCHVYRKQRGDDIRVMLEIDKAVKIAKQRNENINRMLEGMKGKTW